MFKGLKYNELVLSAVPQDIWKWRFQAVYIASKIVEILYCIAFISLYVCIQKLVTPKKTAEPNPA